MRSKVLLTAVLMAVAMLANGANVSREQALQQARLFLGQRGAALGRAMQPTAAAGEPVLNMVDVQASTDGEEPAYYLFNVGEQEGYVIVGGDEQTPVVLGYADSGELSATNMPENMKAWLDSYAAQTKYMRENNIKAQVAKAPSSQAIAPFVTTKWTQGTPYNMMTPSWVQGSSIAKCAVGCLAVAMAQSMSVFRYPAATYNTIPGYENPTSWKINTGEETTATLETVLAGTKIDWANIVDEYKGLVQTLVQRQAVANLMLYCGVSVKTNYSLSSGAVSKKAVNALKTYFGYSQKIVYEERNNYTTEQWEWMIFSELAAGRPVIMDGMTSTSTILAEGHAFVCDGYDGSGMFHINWGWNNGSDGYFLLSALNPPTQGTGGSYSGAGFNYDQAAIVGIAPAGSEEEIPIVNPDTPDTPDTPENPDTPDNPDNPENPDTPTPTPTDDAPSATELTLLQKGVEDTRVKASSLSETSVQYQQKLSSMQTKATALKTTNEQLLEKLNDLELKSNRDDIDGYYHQLIVNCINTVNTQIVPALTETSSEILDGLSYCQNYIDELNRLETNLQQLKSNVDTVKTKTGFDDLLKQSNDAFARVNSMNGMTMIAVVCQEVDYSLRNVESLQKQMDDFYKQVEPLLLEAIDEADPKGEWEMLERMKRKLLAEGDSLDEVDRMLRLEEDVRKTVASQHGTLLRSLLSLEDSIQKLILQVDEQEKNFNEAASILSELQQNDLKQTLAKARYALREARRIDKEVIIPKFDALVLLGEENISNLQAKSDEIRILMQQYPTQELLAEVKLRRRNLEQELMDLKIKNSGIRSQMNEITASENELLASISSARETIKWLESDIQTAVAIAKEVKAQQDEEQRQRDLEISRTQLYTLAPNVSTELLALEGDLIASQESYQNCVTAHEAVLTGEAEFLTEARKIQELLALLPAGSNTRKSAQEKLAVIIQYATQDVPSRISNIRKQLDEAKTEMGTIKAIHENALEQVMVATDYDDILQLLSRITGVETSATNMASQLALIRSELAQLTKYVDEEPDRLSLAKLRLRELEIDINLAILSVDGVKADELQVVERYDMNGRRLPATSDDSRSTGSKGFKIIRYSDGKTKKVRN